MASKAGLSHRQITLRDHKFCWCSKHPKCFISYQRRTMRVSKGGFYLKLPRHSLSSWSPFFGIVQALTLTRIENFCQRRRSHESFTSTFFVLFSSITRRVIELGEGQLTRDGSRGASRIRRNMADTFQRATRQICACNKVPNTDTLVHTPTRTNTQTSHTYTNPRIHAHAHTRCDTHTACSECQSNGIQTGQK